MLGAFTYESSYIYMTIQHSNPHATRLTQLIDAMRFAKVDAFLQPVNDEFQGEYTPDYAKRLEWVSGFSGSAGMALFLREPFEGRRAILFVDGRYTLQAAQQVSRDDYLIINSSDLSLVEWLRANHTTLDSVAYDPWLHSQVQIKTLSAIDVQRPALFVAVDNLIDSVWHDQPSPPVAGVEVWPMQYAGESAESKIARVAKLIADAGAGAAILTLPDGINWLLNIRGGDIAFNPLLLCFALVSANSDVTLFCYEPKRVEGLVAGVKVRPIQDLHQQYQSILSPFKAVLCDPAVSARWFFDRLNERSIRIVEAKDPTLLPKACKNASEIEGMRAAHRRDGVALSQFLAWLDDQQISGATVTELAATAKLESLRQAMGGNLYRGPSFNTIAGSGAHGAIVHYRADESSDRAVASGELFLIDSGGQYLDGTTDVTRTICWGTPSDEMIDRYTRVLMGHIDLAMAVFPEGTSGGQLDALARRHLWEIGCDYDHGTGHGVGVYLCVHEGPQRIGKRLSDVPLKAGMIISNEPGYYKDGEYGIRIENLVLVVEQGKTEKGKAILGFETLTLAPLDERLIDRTMLDSKQLNWLDNYLLRVHSNRVNS